MIQLAVYKTSGRHRRGVLRRGEAATGIVAPGITGYRSRLYPNRDVAQAKQLLAQAGVPNGFPATLSVLNNTDVVTVAEVVQANLADVGIKLGSSRTSPGRSRRWGPRRRAPTGRTSSSITRSGGCPPDPRT